MKYREIDEQKMVEEEMLLTCICRVNIADYLLYMMMHWKIAAMCVWAFCSYCNKFYFFVINIFHLKGIKHLISFYFLIE